MGISCRTTTQEFPVPVPPEIDSGGHLFIQSEIEVFTIFLTNLFGDESTPATADTFFGLGEAWTEGGSCLFSEAWSGSGGGDETDSMPESDDGNVSTEAEAVAAPIGLTLFVG